MFLILSDFSEGGINTRYQVQSHRVERDLGKCSEKFEVCVKLAVDDFNAAIKDDDGRPNFIERKECNYVTVIVEECGKLLPDCFTDKGALNKIDKRVTEFLEDETSGVKNRPLDWDDDKCPVVRDYIARNNSKTEDLLDCDRDAVENRFGACWDK